jgi:hypothetical protein
MNIKKTHLKKNVSNQKLSKKTKKYIGDSSKNKKSHIIENYNNNSDNSNFYDYIYNKSKEIIRYNFKNFKNLFKLYKSVESTSIYSLKNKDNDYKKLYNTVMKYPSYLIWDESKKIIIDSLNDKKDYISFVYEYYYNNNKGVKGTITFNCKKKYLDNVDNIIKKIIKIVGFYVKYTENKKNVPDITIYYIDINKNLPKGSKNKDNVLGKDIINSGFKFNNNIVIYRNEELFKILIHELIHYYNIDEFIKEDNKVSNYLLNNIYNINTPKKELKIYEACTEAIATMLNIIFFSEKINMDNLIHNLYIEIVFSLIQNSKLFKYVNIENSKDIYLKYKKPTKFKQNTFVFEYHYLKSKLLLNFNNLIKFINNNTQNEKKYMNEDDILLNLTIPRINNKNMDEFVKLLDEEDNFDKNLNHIMKTNPDDINIRMTIIEEQDS